MKKSIFLTIFCLSLICHPTKAQSLYFPTLSSSANWDTISPASLGWCSDKVDTLLNYLENRNSKAFILLKDGKIVIEKYFGTFTQDSLWYWASAGKSLTSFLVGIAQQEGHLSINDTTSQYLGQGWTSSAPLEEEKITIRHQLTMTSGLDDGVPDHHCTLSTCLNHLADAGTRWAYHNGPYTLLDSVIESATGLSFNTFTTQKLKLPTGMTGAFIPSGYNNVFYSKARSMARYGLLILNKGNWNGNQIMTDTSYFNQMVNTSQNLNKSYGYLWWLNGKPSFMLPGLQTIFPGYLNVNAPADMIAAIGKNGQVINVVPSQNIVFIRMGDAPGNGSEVSTTFNDTIWQKLNEVMCNSTSIHPISARNMISIYPNPANSVIEIGIPSITDLQIEISNLLGQIVIKEQNQRTVDISALTEGLYIITLKQGTIIFTQKIIKQ